MMAAGPKEATGNPIRTQACRSWPGGKSPLEIQNRLIAAGAPEPSGTRGNLRAPADPRTYYFAGPREMCNSNELRAVSHSWEVGAKRSDMLIERQ